MNPAAHNNVYLFSAYVAVWVVHSIYAFSLFSRGRRIKREYRELNRN